jgi:hypothetical protein
MSPLWVILLLAMVFGSALLLVLAARRAHDEITPTIEAFDRFRAAISPTVASLAVETEATRLQIARANGRLEQRSRAHS